MKNEQPDREPSSTETPAGGYFVLDNARVKERKAAVEKTVGKRPFELELAEIFEKNQSTISRWLNKRHPWTCEQITKILDFFWVKYCQPKEPKPDFFEICKPFDGFDGPESVEASLAQDQVSPSPREAGPLADPFRVGSTTSTHHAPSPSPASPKKLTILCDFDGTMTGKVDTTDGMHKLGAHPLLLPMVEDLETRWMGDQISSRECMLGQAICMSKSKEKKINDYLEAVEIDEHFADFARACRDHDVELIVNSDGYEYAIERVLGNPRNRPRLEAALGCALDEVFRRNWIKLRSNYLFPNGEFYRLRFHHELTETKRWEHRTVREGCRENGIEKELDGLTCYDKQGTCKCRLAREAICQNRRVVVIGNDRTDRCVSAWFADYVFICLSEHIDQNAIAIACRNVGKKFEDHYESFQTFDGLFERITKIINKCHDSDLMDCLREWDRHEANFRDWTRIVREIRSRQKAR